MEGVDLELLLVLIFVDDVDEDLVDLGVTTILGDGRVLERVDLLVGVVL